MRYELIPFHDRQIHAVELAGKVFVVMKPIVEAFGLDWGGQHKRIRNNPVLAEGISVTEIPSAGGTQSMVTLELKMFLGWLLGISTERVADLNIRRVITAFQHEAFDVITDHFQGRGRRPGLLSITEQLSLQIETRRLISELRAEHDPRLREGLHADYVRTRARLGDNAPAALESMGYAASTVEQITAPFWAALRALEAEGVVWNLHRKPQKYWAISLKDIQKKCRKHALDLVVTGMMTDALKRSISPRFIMAETVNTATRGGVHCWVFEAPPSTS